VPAEVRTDVVSCIAMLDRAFAQTLAFCFDMEAPERGGRGNVHGLDRASRRPPKIETLSADVVRCPLVLGREGVQLPLL
jgi:hypothetical protein